MHSTKHMLGAVTGATDGDLDRERPAVAALRLDQLGRRVDEGVGDAIGERIERGPGRHQLRDEPRDVVADDVRDRRIEQPSRGRVGLLHDAVGADGQDRVFDVVEDRVQNGVRLALEPAPRGRRGSGRRSSRTDGARQGFGNAALEAVLRHGEFQSAHGRGGTR